MRLLSPPVCWFSRCTDSRRYRSFSHVVVFPTDIRGSHQKFNPFRPSAIGVLRSSVNSLLHDFDDSGNPLVSVVRDSSQFYFLHAVAAAERVVSAAATVAASAPVTAGALHPTTNISLVCELAGIRTMLVIQ